MVNKHFKYPSCKSEEINDEKGPKLAVQPYEHSYKNVSSAAWRDLFKIEIDFYIRFGKTFGKTYWLEYNFYLAVERPFLRHPLQPKWQVSWVWYIHILCTSPAGKITGVAFTLQVITKLSYIHSPPSCDLLLCTTIKGNHVWKKLGGWPPSSENAGCLRPRY